MSGYGLKIWDSSAELILDLSDKITRLRYSHIADAEESDSIDLPDIDGLLTVQFSISIEAFYFLSHTVVRDGTEISWTPRESVNWTSCDSIILVFLYS